MPTPTAPGVFVEEVPTGPGSFPAVPTAVPAFIGFTEQATRDVAGDLHLAPTVVTSLLDYQRLFGGPVAVPLAVAIASDGAGAFRTTAFEAPAIPYLLAPAVRHYFDCGGGRCLVVSAGTYGAGDLAAGLGAGLEAAGEADEPTLLVIPDAVRLDAAARAALAQAALLQCETRRDRFAIFDLPGGDRPLDATALADARAAFGTAHLGYGAAYYPWLKTSYPLHLVETALASSVQVGVDGAPPVDLVDLRASSPAAYAHVRAELARHHLTLPPCGAVAGVYVATDRNRGVWKAPANVALPAVVEPAVWVDDAAQVTLTVDRASGKAINAIRAFAGRGTLVWGARTLAGATAEWQYVNVRRFAIMVEQSILAGTAWAVFEPNDASTWARVRGLVEDFLTTCWRQGALAGTRSQDAFSVRCGLGSTMTAHDVSAGLLKLEVAMAVIRPGEYLLLRTTLRMQGPP